MTLNSLIHPSIYNIILKLSQIREVSSTLIIFFFVYYCDYILCSSLCCKMSSRVQGKICLLKLCIPVDITIQPLLTKAMNSFNNGKNRLPASRMISFHYGSLTLRVRLVRLGFLDVLCPKYFNLKLSSD